MPPVWRDVGEGCQNKAALVHSGVGKQQRFGRRLRRLASQVDPSPQLCFAGQNPLAKRQKIEVADPWSPPLSPLPSNLIFDGVKRFQNLKGCKIALYSGRPIHEIRP